MRPLRQSAHPGDVELLLSAEAELPPREQQRVEKHLRQCAACRERRAILSSPAIELDLPALPLPSHDAARERLLASLAAQPEATGWAHRLLRPRFYLQAGAVAMLLLVALTWRQAYSPLQDRMAPYEETGPKPNHALTPGAVRPIALTELCTLNDTNLDPIVSPDKERAVFQAYGMDEKVRRAYQVDYLINPQLGGNDDPENLWPEPYHATVWNATAKDALETKLHGLVCSGQIDLADAQKDLATDWIAAYKKYFHTQRPVKTVATLENQF